VEGASLSRRCGRLSAEAAWQAANVDEDWNMEQWGRDELALERRKCLVSMDRPREAVRYHNSDGCDWIERNGSLRSGIHEVS